MDPSNILFWNVHGLNGAVRQDAVRKLVCSSRVDVVCLQEMKMDDFSCYTMLRLFGPDFGNYRFLPSVGASGGVLIAWHDRVGCLGNFRLGSHSVSVQFNPDEGTPWWLTAVYGPQGSKANIQFLQELRDIRNHCQGPWLIGGDFNLICYEADKNNHKLDRAMMGHFRRWINDMNLKELLLHGRHITWTNGHSNPTLVKLDRVLCSVDWEDAFSDYLLQSSATQDSDHCPMLLGLHDVHRGKQTFLFESF
jgi:exonuclease III